MEVIISAYFYKDIKTLRKLKKLYKEALTILLEKGFEEYKNEFPLDKYQNFDIARIDLKTKIKVCNEYINLLKGSEKNEYIC